MLLIMRVNLKENEILDSVNLMGDFCLGKTSNRIFIISRDLLHTMELHGMGENGVSMLWKWIYEEIGFLFDF